MKMKVNFVSFGTENCEILLKKFYEGLLRTCREDFVLHYYSIGYNSQVSGERLIKRKIDLAYQKNPFFYKPMVLMKSLVDIDEEVFIYIDLDVLPTKNFSTVLLTENIKDSKTPLSPNHYWEFPFAFIEGIKMDMGKRVCDLKGIIRCNKYVQACLIIYTKNHFEFLLDWISLIKDERVVEISVDDEELYNATLWKYEQTETLGYLCVTNGTVDIDNLGRFGSIERAYEKFESGEFDKSMFTDRNKFHAGFDSKKVMIFHGIK